MQERENETRKKYDRENSLAIKLYYEQWMHR